MDDDQQFCLRWNNHQSTLVAVFDTLLENGTLVDCTLAAEGKCLNAHKVVLSACSPYFESLLSRHFDKHPILILKDVKFQELKAMMDYMYRGEVNISQDQLGALLKAAESLQIKGLSDNRKGETERKPAPAPPPPKSPQPTSALPKVQGLTIEQRSRDDSREGSMSPGPRKKKRLRRKSEELDNHDASNSSESHSLPAQNIPSSLPAVSKINADVPEPVETKSEILTRHKQSDDIPQVPIIKEKIETHTELMLEPKSEYVEEMNEDSIEDLTLDDDDLSNMEQMDDQAGPSHGNAGEGSSQGFGGWHMGNQSQDEVFLAAQEAVGAHRDSQVALDIKSNDDLDDSSDEDITEDKWSEKSFEYSELKVYSDEEDEDKLSSSTSSMPKLVPYISDDSSITTKIEISETKIVGEADLASASNSEKNKKIRRRHNCLFCHVPVLTFSRHLRRRHSKEPVVMRIFSLRKSDPKRKQLISRLRKEGDFCTVDSLPVRSVRRQVKTSSCSDEDLLPCTFCKGFYAKTNLARHVKKCFFNDTDPAVRLRARSRGQTIMAKHFDSDDPLLTSGVLNSLNADVISLTAKKDETICEVGRKQVEKSKDKHEVHITNGYMRRLARLLIEARNIENDNTLTLLSLLHPSKFDTLVEATKTIAEYNEETKTFGISSLASQMGSLIKKGINAALSLETKKDINSPTINTLDDMKNIINDQWSTEIHVETDDQCVGADEENQKESIEVMLKNLKPKAKRHLRPWTEEQKRITDEFFKDHIERKSAPRKSEVLNLIEQFPEIFSNRNWATIKVYVQNKYTNKLAS